MLWYPSSWPPHCIYTGELSSTASTVQWCDNRQAIYFLSWYSVYPDIEASTGGHDGDTPKAFLAAATTAVPVWLGLVSRNIGSRRLIRRKYTTYSSRYKEAFSKWMSGPLLWRSVGRSKGNTRGGRQIQRRYNLKYWVSIFRLVYLNTLLFKNYHSLNMKKNVTNWGG